MAEKDPCEVVLPEEEEEVSPEYQQTSAPTGVPGIPGVRFVATQQQPNVTALNMTPQMQALQSGVETLENESVQQVMRDLETERVQQVLNGDLGEGLENDISLTPVFQNKLSAEKSTWVITNTSLLDFGRVAGNLEFDQDKFNSKPAYMLHSFVGTDRRRTPPNIIDNTYRIDPLRWIGDRMWFNAGHIGGPIEYETAGSAKNAHGNFMGPDFYFINSEKGIFDRGWAKLYVDGSKNLHIKSGGPANLARWRNLDPLLEQIRSRNSTGFKVKYEHHELVGSKRASSNQDWSWKDYLYGNVRNEVASQIVPSDGRPSEKRQAYREAALRQDQTTGWRSVSAKYAENFNYPNLNPFPVIPFYGDDFELTKDTDPARLDSPPTVGRVMFEDFTTNVTDLLSKEEADVVDIGNKSYFDIRTVYSYFDCLYERIFSPVLDELELPSPYMKKPELSFETSGFRTQGISRIQKEDFESLIFSRLEIADILTGTNYFSSARDLVDTSEATRPTQQVEYVEDLIQVGNRDAKRKIAELMKDYYGFNINNDDPDVYLSGRTPEELDIIYNERYLNPMFVEMELGSIEKSQLAEAMTFNGDNTIVRGMFGALVRRNDTETRQRRSFLSGRTYEVRNTDIINASYVDQLLQSGLSSDSDELATKIEFSDTIKIEESLSLDFSEWFDSVFDFYTSGINAPTSPIEKFANIFRLLTIRAKVARFVNSRVRTYSQVMSGVPAKSEVLVFVL